MKTLIFALLTIFFCSIFSSSFAFDVDGDGKEGLAETIHSLQVVSGMLPSNSKIIFVGDIDATSVENGTVLLDVLENITDASDSKPYLIKLEPGIYDLGSGSLNMKRNIDIEGSGEKNTSITSATTGHLPNYPTVNGASDAEIRFLRIENTGTGTYSVAFRNYASSSTVTHVTAVASGGTYNHAVTNYLGTPVYRNVTAIANGSATTNRAFFTHNSSPVMSNVTAFATGGSNNYGIYNDVDGTPEMKLVSSNGVLISGRLLFIPSGDDEEENGDILLSIGEVISGLNDNAAPDGSSRYLVTLDAGTYDLGDERFEMLGYVDLAGSGENLTTIVSSNGTGTKESSGTILGAYNSEIRDLTVINTSAEYYAIAITNSYDKYGSNLKNMVAVASGGSNNIGVYYNFATENAYPAVMTNVIADTTVFGNNDNYAVYVVSSTLTMNNVTARSVKDENVGYDGNGVYVFGDSSYVRINSSHLIGYGGISTEILQAPVVILSGTFLEYLGTNWNKLYCYGSYAASLSIPGDSLPLTTCGGNL